MFQGKLIALTFILVAFSYQIVPTESGYVIQKLKDIGKTVCNFFHPSHESSTTDLPPVEQKTLGESAETTPTYDIDVRANEDGMEAKPLLEGHKNCRGGQFRTASGQCRNIV